MGSQFEGRTSLGARGGDEGQAVRSMHIPEGDLESGLQSMDLGGTGAENSSAPAQRVLGNALRDGNASNGSIPLSPPNTRELRDKDAAKSKTGQDRSRINGSTDERKPHQRICNKCGEPLTGQFVRALGGTFHLECFKCQDCGQVVASKFFPVDSENGESQYPLCETDYFRRLDLICTNCGGALRGSYVTALDHKYHIEHFTCSVCPTAFGAKDSYYEHEGKVYCHFHYSTRFAQRCNGCHTAILKQFVEIFRNGQNQHWHPECYMIHKFWNVRLVSTGQDQVKRPTFDADATEEQRKQIREVEELMEERVYKIWSVLSSFEESSAACISEMLLQVSNGAYVDGVLVAKKFIWHVDILFAATDRLDKTVISEGYDGLSYGREAKLLCKKIVAFFSLLSKTAESGLQRLGVTQELLSLVTGLAHYLKLLIRISLQGALKIEREKGNTDGLHNFLADLSHLATIKDQDASLDSSDRDSTLAAEQADLCYWCQEPVDDECLQIGQLRWHSDHLHCSSCRRDIAHDQELGKATWSEKEQKAYCSTCSTSNQGIADGLTGFERTSRLQQYVYLLRVALARLLSVLRSAGTLPHTSDDPNLSHYDSNEGHRVESNGRSSNGMLSPDSRSKSYGGISSNDQAPSSYEETVGEMKRLRSKRMDKHLSTTIKRARTSRIIDGPEGQSIANGLSNPFQYKNGFRIEEDRDINGDGTTDLKFGHQDALTLDDIPRIVAAEQAKEQRPNAYKHARSQLLSSGRQPKLIGGHQRDVNGNRDLDGAGGDYPLSRTKRYFSELSALEYFIVRHIAVLQMQPLLEGHFSLEDLLSLIESRKPTFWGKLFKNDKTKLGKKKGVFGVSLDTLVEKDGVESTFGVGPGALRIPSTLDDTISAMRQMDMSVEGVFRKNGNIRGLKDLAEKIDAKETDVDLSKENPVQVAALLKKFLRELPDPLLTYKLHELFTTSQKIGSDEKKTRVLHLTCCLLPKSHRDSVEVLFAFLNWAASFSQVDEESGSKMDTHNIATVITPNILRGDSRGPGMDESFLAIEAVNMLIECNDQMSEVPEDIQSILNDTALYNNTSDITTKEILKRYGEVVHSNKTPTTTTPSPTTHSSTPPLRDRETNRHSTRPPASPVYTHVDTNPHAWQKESSVRHVPGNGNGNGSSPYLSSSLAAAPTATAVPPTTMTNQNTPPQPAAPFEFAHVSSAYHQRAGSSESAASYGGPGSRLSQKPAGWGRQSGAGAMGVTGAG